MSRFTATLADILSVGATMRLLWPALVVVSKVTLHCHVLPPESRSLIPEPSTALLLLLLATLVLESFQLFLGQALATPLGLETATVMAIGSSVNIEESVHLAFALVLIIMEFWINPGLLKAASEAVEVSCSGIVSCAGVGKAHSSSSRFLFLFFGFPSIVCIGIIVAMDSRIVAAILAFRRG